MSCRTSGVDACRLRPFPDRDGVFPLRVDTRLSDRDIERDESRPDFFLEDVAGVAGVALLSDSCSAASVVVVAAAAGSSSFFSFKSTS